MSKRDDDSQADMEVGMTTAERRRRRRRGGGLRVPSDNVPRGSRSSTPPVVAPVPEDPSLAMSIAYSFNNDASEPVPRVALDTASAKARAARVDTNVENGDAESAETPLETIESIEALEPDPSDSLPMAPEAMSTMIDPPSAPVESADFEMKTREMTAVDLEALGLSNEIPASLTTTDPGLPGVEMISAPPAVPTQRIVGDAARSAEVEIDVSDSSSVPKVVEAETSSDGVAAPGRYVRERKERLKTVALTEEDLEEVREAVRAATQPAETPATRMPPPPALQTAKTQPLSQKDLEPILGSGEIDIQELSERSSESSGEIEVDVSDEDLKSGPIVAPALAQTSEPHRSKPPSVPPPIAPQGSTTSPGILPGRTVSKPPVAHKPPTPPPAPAKRDTKENPPTAAKVDAIKSPPVARTTTEPMNKRGKPWFIDLFDEDYLRTLPFLTPQATQAEAEFVIDAMGLQPGAQVLDLGCGYGRHAMELAARGFHVVGLDLSTPLLVRGGEEAHRRNLQINFVRGDMRELDFEAQFDGAYCLFSTFGYFDDETNKKTVANVARALKPGGRVLIEILNRDYVIADLPTRVWWEGDGCVVLEEVELNYFSSRIQVNRSVVFDDGRQLEQEISVRAYSLHEVGKLMHAAGFRVLEVSGGYHTRGRFFGNQSRHIIVLAERKEVSASSP